MDNKIIIITGGSGLLGKSIVKLLISKNNKVVNFDISDFNFSHPNYYYLKTDITNLESIDKSIEEVNSKIGSIYGLVNNAYPRTKDWNKKFNEINFQSWSKNIHMQLNSVFYITQKCCEIMSKNLQGSVVNIASIYGVVGNDMSIYENTNITPPAAYSAIKGGLINFTKYLASYYGSKSIRVNCVSPGGVYDNQDKTFVKNYCKKVPLKRMAKADDISPSVCFLLSDESKYITGHNLIVDGGWTAI